MHWISWIMEELKDHAGFRPIKVMLVVLGISAHRALGKASK